VAAGAGRLEDADILEAARHPAVRGLDPHETFAMVSFLRHERRQE